MARYKIEQEHDYADAVELLAALPEHLRDGKLLEKARAWRDRAATLDRTVRDLVTATRTEGLRDAVTELLKYWPQRADLRRLLEILPKEPDKEIVNSVGMKLVVVRAGTFLLAEAGTHREVAISRPFYLGVYPVTQQEYKKVMGANPSHFKGSLFMRNWDHPVEMVTWDMAVEFCHRLSSRSEEKRAARLYRLPTEAEWEYACRAGTRTAYSFGDDASALANHAWFSANSGSRTHPVGQKRPNAWGLHDMHGHVWEWCGDQYSDYNLEDKKDHQREQNRGTRVMRGGSWYSGPEFCRAAFRNRNASGARDIYFGLRVCFHLD